MKKLEKEKYSREKTELFRDRIDMLLKYNDKKINTLPDLETFIGVGLHTIRKAYNENRFPTERTQKKLVEKMGISRQWWETGEGDIFSPKYPIVNESEVDNYGIASNSERMILDQVAIPVVEVKAQASYLRSYQDTAYLNTLPKIYVSREFDSGGNFVAFRIGGDSMDDGRSRAIKDQDIYLCKELDQKHWTNKSFYKEFIFVIVHENGILCKEIIDHDVKNSQITCHSWNPSPEFEDFTLELKKCKQLFCLRKLVERRVKL